MLHPVTALPKRSAILREEDVPKYADVGRKVHALRRPETALRKRRSGGSRRTAGCTTGPSPESYDPVPDVRRRRTPEATYLAKMNVSRGKTEGDGKPAAQAGHSYGERQIEFALRRSGDAPDEFWMDET